MRDRNDIQRLVDTYADGGLNEEQARDLVELLKESDDVGRRFAVAAVMERLLTALGRGETPVARIMARVKAERPEDASIFSTRAV